MSYQVVMRPAGEAEGEVLPLLHGNLQVQGDAHSLYRWGYVDAPPGAGSLFLLRHQEADEAAATVGCCGVSRRLFAVEDAPTTAALLGDFAIDRLHRTARPALLLQRALQEHVRGRYGLAYGFPNDSAVSVFRRIGYRELGQTTRYALVLRHRHYLRRVIPSDVLSGAGGLVLDSALRGQHWFRAGRSALWRRLRRVSDPDQRFDELWDSQRARHAIVARRDAAFLRWRFLRKPNEQFEILALEDRGGGRLQAYAVLQTLGRVAHVRDVLGRDLGEVRTLLDRMLVALQGRPVDSVSFRVLGAPALRRVFTECGFAPREGGRTVIAQLGDALAGDATRYEPERWYITDADEDT